MAETLARQTGGPQEQHRAWLGLHPEATPSSRQPRQQSRGVAANRAGLRAPLSVPKPQERHKLPHLGGGGEEPNQGSPEETGWGDCICQNQEQTQLGTAKFQLKTARLSQALLSRSASWTLNARAGEERRAEKRGSSCHPHLLCSAREYKPKKANGTDREGYLERHAMEPKCPLQSTAWKREPLANRASLSQPCGARGCGQTLAETGLPHPLPNAPHGSAGPVCPAPNQGYRPRPAAHPPSGRRRRGCFSTTKGPHG